MEFKKFHLHTKLFRTLKSVSEKWGFMSNEIMNGYVYE